MWRRRRRFVERCANRERQQHAAAGQQYDAAAGFVVDDRAGLATFTPPVAPTSALKVATGSLNEGGTSNNDVVSFRAAVDMTVSGRLNNIWVSAASPNGKATVSGDMNTIVFLPGVSAQVSVTGSGNTFYVPTGASIAISGTGAAVSTIRNYVP